MSEVVDASLPPPSSLLPPPPPPGNKRKADEMNASEADAEAVRRRAENQKKEVAISTQLTSEGWQLGKRRTPLMNRVVRFVDSSEDGRPELLLWEEGRVYAYLAPDETMGDPALFKVTYIVDYEEETFGFTTWRRRSSWRQSRGRPTKEVMYMAV